MRAHHARYYLLTLIMSIPDCGEIAPMERIIWSVDALVFVVLVGVVIYVWGVPMPTTPDVSALAYPADMDVTSTLLVLLPALALAGSVALGNLGRRNTE